MGAKDSSRARKAALSQTASMVSASGGCGGRKSFGLVLHTREPEVIKGLATAYSTGNLSRVLDYPVHPPPPIPPPTQPACPTAEK